MRLTVMLAGAALLLPVALAAQVTLDGNRLVLPGKVNFPAGKAVPNPSAEASIEAVAKYMADKKYITTLRIEGHVAMGGQPQQLSQDRAMAVAKALVAKGVDCKRLFVVGFGNSKPVTTPSSSSENTRIEFVNAALRGKPIGGLPVDGGGWGAGDPCKP
ncbi:OmpA family protein [uncultured Sphingorhabdus sp.]|uniref:OmpA family protein n=1 Tax=uncultured Sphingorhabdus sp. TaxID=1686106 RepID=UPI0026300A67|nr:OmpA family protein [uncultured Sphingorhabdus sp.]HMS21452.1 OmpA family protein [Sphingorhabdus sp.]